MSEAATLTEVEMELKIVEHKGVKLIVMMERKENRYPRFVRIVVPETDDVPDGFGRSVRCG